jgi:serine/threonine protein kinase
LLKELGRGAFSIVYRVRTKDSDVPQEFAAKVMDKLALGPKKMELVSTEVDIMRRLSHPNILRLHQLFDSPVKIVLVLELLTGGELHKVTVDVMTW